MRSVQPSIAISGAFLITLGLFASCSPQGQWTPVLHSPNQAFLAQSGSNPSASGSFLRTQSGLPEACKTEIASPLGTFCLSCRYEPWFVQRCYDYAGAVSPDEQCVHTPDQIKCLMDQPLFALVLPLKRSQERALLENYLTWEATVRDIWEGRLEDLEKESMKRLLQFTRNWAEHLTQRRAAELSDDELLASFASVGPQSPNLLSQLRRSLENLQKERLAGRLNLISYLQEIRNVLGTLDVLSPLQEYLNALSLEGLEEGI